MKILFLTPRPFWLDFGGQEVQLLKTKRALETLGAKVFLADYFDENQINNINLVHFFGSDYVYAQIARRLIAKKIPYCVSPVFYPMGIERLAHLFISKIPYTQSYLRKFLLKNATQILPNSKNEALLLRKLFGLSVQNVSIIPNAVENNFIGTSPTNFLRKFFTALSPNEPFVLSVGRIEKRKNSLLTAKACVKLNLPVIFIGRHAPTETDYSQKFFSFISRFPHQIKHIPFLPSGGEDLANAYAAAHVHCLCSTMETPGLSSLEAGLNGANLVVGECPPVREYFEGIAHFTTPRSLNDLVKTIETAFSKKRNFFNQSETIAKRYTWDKVGEKTLAAYNLALTIK